MDERKKKVSGQVTDRSFVSSKCPEKVFFFFRKELRAEGEGNTGGKEV